MIVTLANSQTLEKKPIPSESLIASQEIETTVPSLDELLKECGGVLLRFHTIFPFDLFPDEVIIDEHKINIVTKKFFMTYHVHSVLISDITDVSVDTSMFFASLNIVDSSNFRFPIEIRVGYLSKENAFAARKLLQGLIAAKRRNVSL